MRSLIFIFFVLLYFSCDDNPTQVTDNNLKYYYGEKYIDLNDDGKDDIYWERRFIGNETESAAMYSIYPLNDTELLYCMNIGHQPLEIGDTVKYQVIDPYSWHSLRADLASYNYNTHHWNGPWVAITNYLPVKILINDSLHCGWINLTMDTLDQKIEFHFSNYNPIQQSDFIIKK